MIIKMSENIYYTHPRLSVGFSRLVKKNDPPDVVQDKPAFSVVFFFSNYQCDLTSVKKTVYYMHTQCKKILKMSLN